MDDHDVRVRRGDDHLGAVRSDLHPHQPVVVERLGALKTLAFGIPGMKILVNDWHPTLIERFTSDQA